jgi:hypothetical protein
MTAPAVTPVKLALSDLDSAVYDAHRWSRVLMDLSSCSSPVDAESLGIIADAMTASARQLRQKFDVAWKAAGGEQ